MYKKETLDNGLMVITEKIPHVRSVSIGLFVDVGSRYEDNKTSGISHFIEHMMFKGTERRTAKEIAESLDSVGGQLNAFTTKEYTCYYARVLDEYFSMAVDVLIDMVFSSLFIDSDINRERNVIIEEIKMCEDTPDELVHDIFASTVWGEHALGRPIIGSYKAIKEMSKEEMVGFYNKYYNPGKIIVAVAGNIDHDNVVAELSRTIKYTSSRPSARAVIKPVPQIKTTCRKKDTEQVHLCVGVPGMSLKDDQIYVLHVINTILGGGISSRLFQEIREKRGLVYSVYSYHTSYHDTGLFCIYAGLSKENVEEVLDLIFHQIGKLHEEGVGEAELKKVKDQLKGNLLLSMENVNTRMSRLGKSQLYLGEIIPVEDIVGRIQKVTSFEVKELARTFMKYNNFCLASIGPWDKCDYFDKIITS